MTAPERLAKVAEPLLVSAMRRHPDGIVEVVGDFAKSGTGARGFVAEYDEAIAAAEARGAARVREAVEAGVRTMDEAAVINRRIAEGSLSHSTRQMALLAAECREGDAAKLRAALGGAEKAAVEGVAGAVSAEDGLSGHGDAGRGSEA